MEETGALAGKVAVVTGAARNIGRAIALALGGEGAAVLVNALGDGQAAETVAGEVTAAGGRGLAHLADVTDEAAVNGMADAAVQAFGRIERMGRAGEIAAMVRHLCLPGGAYITGQTIHVNGGMYLA